MDSHASPYDEVRPSIPALDLSADLTGLHGAPYNPRAIADEDITALQESIRALGCVKPIIACRHDGLILAGHQRTRALREMGVARAPVYWLDRMTHYDQATLNQFHNGTDLDSGDENAHLSPFAPEEVGRFVIRHGLAVRGNFRASMAAVRDTLAGLIKKHGPFGACVATQSGRVIHCAQYALASGLAGTPLACYVIPDERAREYAAFLGRGYGVFSYDHLEREDYIQAMGQLFRLRNIDTEGRNGKVNKGGSMKSVLQENWIKPYLLHHKEARILDLGAGQRDYPKRHYWPNGYRLTAWEPFPRVGGAKVVNVSECHRMTDRLIEEVEANGLFDVVIGDVVLSSIDHQEKEWAFMRCLNLFLKPGGLAFFSGRDKAEHEIWLRSKRASNTTERLRLGFQDRHGRFGLLNGGQWFYQTFHNAEDVARLHADHGFAPYLPPEIGKRPAKPGTTWQACARKIVTFPWEECARAIEIQFNLKVGEGRRFGRHEDVKRAVQKIYESGA